MEQQDLFDLRETVARLQEEIRSLRFALETTDVGKTMLQQREEFKYLLSVGKLIVSELNLEKVFELVADNARKIVNAELVLVPMLNEQRDKYTYVAASGTEADDVRGTTFNAHVGMCGWVLQHERSLLFGETSTHWMDEKTTWEEAQQSAVLVPMIGRKGIIGGLSALGKQGGGPFTQHDLDLLTMFANQVSIAIENAQLFQQVTREKEERKQAEENLREREKALDNLFNNTEVAMFRSRLDGSETLNANDKFLELAGRAREEVIGKPSMLYWADSAQREEMIRILKANKRIVDFEFKMLNKKGEVRECVTSLNLYPEEGILDGSIIDITELKRAEEALRENQVRLDLALQAAHMGVWRWEIKENRRYYDNLTCQLLGINEATFTGAAEEFFAVVHPDDKEKVKTALSRAIEQNVPFDVTYRVIWPEGSIHYISSRSRLVRDDLGQPERFNGIVWDVTEQHVFEKELLEKEKKYRALFDLANDGIFIQDETGFTDCNLKGTEMYGLTKSEIIGRSPSEFAPEYQPDGRLSSEVAGEKIRAALSGTPQVFEWQPIRADGSPFDVEITLSRLELGGKMYLQAIVRDIGERKRLEQERLKTQKLESIGTLAGGIAHDFNNLLQGIFGYISLAKLKRDDKTKSLAALEEAEKALHMSVRLTNQLLTFSKGGKPVMKPVHLQPVIENATKFALSGSRNAYSIVVNEDLWYADADEGQISQVIQNIVLNADQAMPKGGNVEITARNVHIPGPELPQGLEGGRYVEITIRDNGIGIPEGYISKIFDPYFTTKERGSGLGLATSYSIIKNHNGAIEVKSEVGKGTSFVLYLPAAAETLKQKDLSKPTILTPERTARVLVMDDDPVILDVACEMISALGHSVECVTQGNEAIEKYQEAQLSGRPFDVVILDLTIRGGMGGIETLQKLTGIDPQVKVVVSSGYSDDAGIAGYREQGFKAFLKKPYNVDELQEVLNGLLRS